MAQMSTCTSVQPSSFPQHLTVKGALLSQVPTGLFRCLEAGARGRCCPRIHLPISRERGMWGQTQPTIFTLWLRQGHRVHTPWKGTAIRPQPDTRTRTVSNGQQLANVVGTTVIEDGSLRVLSPSTCIQNCTGHGAGPPRFSALRWSSLVLSCC